MSRKKKVLIVHNYYQIPGGEDVVVANEKRMLEEHGNDVILYQRNNSELKGFSNVRKILLPFSTVFNIRTYRDIKKLIKDQQIDIVHVHNTLNLISPSVYYAAVQSNIPIVQTVHNFRLLCPGAIFYRDGKVCEDCVRFGLSCAVKHGCYRESRLQTAICVVSTMFHRMTGIYGKLNYICLTEFNKEKLLQFKQIESERIFVKPNFVKRTSEAVPDSQRENRFIFAGRIDKLKGMDILLNAWKLMGDKAPELIICGTGPMEEWCKEYIAENNLASIEMKGFVPNSEVRKLIAKSKALVLPTQWYEGFPMSIVEAFSVGTPVVTSDLGNAGNLVTEGVTGSKFTADSPKELMQAVKRVETYKDIHDSTKSEYRKKYTEPQNYDCLMKIYDTVR